MATLSITKLRSLTASKLKELVDANSPVIVMNRSKPVVEIYKVGTAPVPEPTPTPTPDPTPDPTPTPGPTAGLPSEVVGRKWTVMAPFSKAGSTDSPENLQILKAETDSRYKSVFYVSDKGVVFKTRADGVHSPNSKYPRCELREMKDEAWTNGSWSNASGTHTLEGTYSIRHTLVKRPQLCFAQMHDASDDVFECCYDAGKLVCFYEDKAKTIILEPAYIEGTTFSVKLVASGGKTDVYYNGQLKGSVPKSGSGLYWKSGCYLQSNVANWAEAPDAYGEVTISSLKLSVA
jgi:hypothetical protein